ncbi:MAG: cupin domain-containing protein [Bacteroidetes bacterium]|nr:cupin domain-containing protein [Bacteroidota bacterium]
MEGFKDNIEKAALENNNFRYVIYTGKHLQLVLMSLKAGEDIGEETHKDIDQFFRFESGEGKCFIDESEYIVKEGDVIVVPAGAKHNVVNTGTETLKLYTIYGPPNHQNGTIRTTKEEAQEFKEKFTGVTSE